MPFALIVKKHSVLKQYETLAVIPCCGYQLKARPNHFKVRDNFRGGFTVRDYSLRFNWRTRQIVKRCDKCHRWLQVHTLWGA